ncbi:MAG: UDP-glucose/GDP-mannose dehydrogenase family protein [Bdellovibrionales bacterium]|nr:UDP-glucose/GDP-mannose dehydrogenase family protein [Bdellovibrionales bacterium]
MRIAVVGTGYVGLVAGTCFAETGNTVTCVDIDPAKVARLQKGEPTIFEPGLEEMMVKNQEEKRLFFTTNLKDAVEKSDVLFLAVGTPSSVDGSADLSAVLKVAEDIGTFMNGSKVIVNKSTVPVGTARRVSEKVASRTKHSFHVVSNPEFLKEGSAIDDFLKPDRVVIGTGSDEAWNVMKELYDPFVRQGNPIIRMSNLSAEMTKYAANAMLATKISFINEIALLCDRVGADVESVRAGITSDARIGRHFLYPGPGYGGSCFPKDVKALLKTGREAGLPMHVIAAAEEANDSQKQFLGQKMEKHFGGAANLKGKIIAVWGLAFKPNTDDMREAPSIPLVRHLTRCGARVQAFDPIAHETAPRAFEEAGIPSGQVAFSESAYKALEGADALALVTEWNEFRTPDFETMRKLLKAPVLFDGRNLWKPDSVKARGFTYYGVGRS